LVAVIENSKVMNRIRGRFQKCLLPCVFLLLGQISLASDGWERMGSVTSVKVLPHGVELTAGRARVRITAILPSIIRVRYSQGEEFPAKRSFAVLSNNFSEPPSVRVDQSAEAILMDSGAIQVEVRKSPLRIVFMDSNGSVVSQDQPGYPVSFKGRTFRVWKSMPQDEHYFGLGDKSGPLDHRNLAFTMWNTGAFGRYKSIPFFLAMRKGSAYGIFLDNTYRSNFDFGKASRDTYSFGADGGELDYYFFYGPDPKRVVGDFTRLVGRTPLPPLFALGYQQCRYSYYPESRLREVASEFRKRKIPADVVYLDIDYQQNNRPFTIDRKRFPTFEKMITDLNSEGFKVVAITDLHLAKLAGYKPYEEGIRGDYFVKNPDGSVFVGKVWPGDSVFPDFTRDAVRDWWGTLYADFVHMGIRGFWDDMNEPAVFKSPDRTMPLDIVHSVEGRTTDHREVHNVFGMENARGTYEGLLRLQPDVRPFVLTRAAFAGAERYAATWTGDNSSNWKHMRLSIPQLLNLGVSGYAFVGDDIGGFDGSPTPELLTRWMELGAFNPIYRNHATKGSRNREPWVDGPQHEAIRRHYIELRYQLLPYIYTSMEETSRTGIPLMRPMFLQFPDQPALENTETEFMFGPDLLVAPKVDEKVVGYKVKLPAGVWYDFWTGHRVESATQTVDPALDAVPVYVRGGAIVPEEPVVQSTAEVPQGSLRLLVYPGPDCHGSMYQDDGNTLAYTRGEFLRLRFTCEQHPDSLHLSISSAAAHYDPWWRSIEIEVFGVASQPRSVSVNGNPDRDWRFDSRAQTLTLNTAAGPTQIVITE